jgi:AbiV family abortive infection protein
MDTIDVSKEVLENADRLLNDARLLFEHGRFPTSASLAILSIEEFGKAIRGMSVGHLEKQKAAISFGLINHFVEHLKSRGLSVQRFDPTTERQPKPRNPALERKVEEALTALDESHLRGIEGDIHNKDIAAIKNRGFYVDLDNAGNVVSLPDAIDSTIAKRLIDTAHELIHSHTAMTETLIAWSNASPNES